MGKIDRAWVRRGEGDFPDTAIIVRKQPYAEPLERESVKLRRILWALVVAQALALAGAGFAAYYAHDAAQNAERAALYVQARPIQQESQK